MHVHHGGFAATYKQLKVPADRRLAVLEDRLRQKLGLYTVRKITIPKFEPDTAEKRHGGWALCTPLCTRDLRFLRIHAWHLSVHVLQDSTVYFSKNTAPEVRKITEPCQDRTGPTAAKRHGGCASNPYV